MDGVNDLVVFGDGHTIQRGSSEAHLLTNGAIIGGQFSSNPLGGLLVLGNGTASSKSNAVRIDWDGNGYISGLGTWEYHGGYSNLRLPEGTNVIKGGSNGFSIRSGTDLEFISREQVIFITPIINLHNYGSSEPISITGVKTPETDNLYHAVNVEYVEQRLTDIIGKAPGTLDTLEELAKALGEDENWSVTVLDRLDALDTNKMDTFGTVQYVSTNTSAGYVIRVPNYGTTLSGHTYFRLNQGTNTLSMTTQTDSSNAINDVCSLGNTLGKTILTSPIIQMLNANVLNLSTSGTVVTGVAASTDLTSAVNLDQLNTRLATKMYKWGTVNSDNSGNRNIVNDTTGNLVFSTKDGLAYVSLCPGAGGITDLQSMGGIRLGATGIQMLLTDSQVSLTGPTTSGVALTGIKTPTHNDSMYAANVQYVNDCLTVTNW
ncbi:MAG: hypothetical protein IJA19_02545 [Clostridia bacterium]|nr:hypothetical protein [Clostridia bacterium]